MVDNANPLRKFFRQPAVYIKLPSDGNFWPEGSVSIPPNRELPVYPMTALDEITYRTADSLFNGSAIVNVIQSCVPNIKDAWQVPSVDVDTILVAIRIASAGHQMDFDSVCPHCQNENNFGLDLRTVLDGVRLPNYGESIGIGNIEIFFKPLSYQQMNQNATLQFEDQKLIEMIPNADIPENEKLRRLNEAFLKLSAMTLDALSQSISMIKADNEIVTESQYIKEFVANCSRDVFDKVRERIVELKEQGELKPLKIRCQNPECQKDYETPFTLDVSNFFASAS